MIPKTKFEKQVFRLFNERPSVNLKFVKKDLDNLFPSYCYPHYKDDICGDCQSRFRMTPLEKKQPDMKCPHCKRPLLFINDRQPVHRASRITVTYDTVEDVQIFKYVTVIKHSFKHNKPEFFFRHEFDIYINMKGQSRIVRYDRAEPLLTSPPPNSVFYNHDSHKSYNTSMVHHLLLRNGYNDSTVIRTFRSHVQLLLTDNFYESMIKLREFDIARYYQRFYEKKDRISFVNEYKKIIHQGLRLNFDFSDINIFLDYLEAVRFLGYNLKDPKILFPKNLREAHDIAINLRYEIRNKIREKEELRKRAMAIYQYIEKKDKYLDFKITSGNITIVPLKNVFEFEKEGTELDHCVFKSEYYEKDDSLILSAMVDGQKAETVEIIISKREINQCYGYNNTFTLNHRRIVKLVKSNMNKILNINEQNRRSNRKLQASNI